MRGLPQPPDDIAELRHVFDVDGSRATLAFWLRVPGLQTLAVSQLELVVADFLTWSMPLFGNVTHRGCQLTRVDLTRWGSSPLRVIRQLLPVRGRWTGGQVLVATSTLQLLAGEGGRGNDSVVHIPGFPDVFTDDHRSLNSLGWGTLSSQAAIFLAGVGTITSPAGGTCQLGTVHRSSAGVPLAVATFSFAIGIRPGALVGTLDRRRLT